MEVAVLGAVASTLLPRLQGAIRARQDVLNVILYLQDDLKHMEAVLREIEAASPGFIFVGNPEGSPADQLKDDITQHYDDVIRLTYSIEQCVHKFMAHWLINGPIKRAIANIILPCDFSSGIRTFNPEIKRLNKWFSANRVAISEAIEQVSHSHAKDADIPVGLHVQVKDDLVKKLTYDGRQPKGQLKIASIHGPPGVGKSTVAAQVYTELKPKFELTALVTVSTNQEILRNILRQISQKDHESIDQKDIVQAMREALQNKRYFLVIENICEMQAWDIIKSALTEDYNGSAVLTTTNSADIAGYVGGGHKLETPNVRSFFASYNHLSPNTRSCLLYLSLFQKGYEISVDRLIWGWIAEGFVYAHDGITSQEKGDKYLTELMEKKFIEVVEVDAVGKALCCRVHDRMHDVLVACSAQRNFATILDGRQGSSVPPSVIHRLSIQGNKIKPLLKEDRLFHVQSLVVSGDGNLLPPLSNFRGLRVFELGSCDSLQDLRGIGSLSRLRCLVMGSTFSSKIQEEIGKLVLLQTLDLRATNLKELPQSVFQISQLRRLCVNSRTKIPDGIGKMVNLEELGDINISKPELLKKLCNLTKLRVLRIAVWSSDERYGNRLLKYLCSMLKKPNIEGKSPRQAIQSLSILTCCSVHFWDKSYNRYNRIDLSLPKLEIRHSKFQSLPGWIRSIQKLSSLSIEVYKISPEIIVALGNLQHLESLSLTSTSKRYPEPEVRFGKNPGAFGKLTSFRIVSNAMGEIFATKEAMPELRRFTLSFEASRTEHVPQAFNFGLENLPSSLEHVRVEIICSSASPRVVEQAEAAIREAIEKICSPKIIVVEIQRILDEHMVEEDEVEQTYQIATESESPDESSKAALPDRCVQPNANKTDEVRSQITQLMIDNMHHQLKLLNHDAKVKDILRDTGLSKDEAHQLVQESRGRVKHMMKQVLEVECGSSDKSAIVERLYNLGKSNGQHKEHLTTGGNVCHGEGPGAAEAQETSRHSTTAVQALSAKGTPTSGQAMEPRCPLDVTIDELPSSSMSVPQKRNKEVITKGTGIMQIEDGITKNKDTKPLRRHNKPKKAQDYVVSPLDYACTADDRFVIENIKFEPSRNILVRIKGTVLYKPQLISLLTPGEFIGDEVINAYIHCISVIEHLRVRLGGSVFLENACISEVIKYGHLLKDGTHVAPRWVLDIIEMYLKNDMIFIPINIKDSHWYLCVINIKKRCVQVLDSQGPNKERKELIDTLKVLEDIFKFVSKREDLNITAWKVEECIQSKLQTDGSSCGLWMLNFMEYFTGDSLSDIPNQVDMTNFRTKIAVILVDSELNDADMKSRLGR